MKKIFNVMIMGTILTLISSSCNKDFIDIPPVASISPDGLYITNSDFDGAMVGVYDTYQNTMGAMFRFDELPADDAWDELRKNPNLSYDTFIVQSDENNLLIAWTNFYVIIGRCNMILQKLETAKPSLKDQFIGEARFLRALAYFKLVQLFGDVPMITKPLSIEEGYKAGRTAKATIYSDVIIKDLQDAAAKLPAKRTGSTVGRATSGAAKSILGRVYLQISDFVKAEAILQEVINANTYKLLANWNDLWDFTKDEHHSEYIFDIEYEKGFSGEGSGLANSRLPKDTKLAAFYGVTGGGTDDYNIPPSFFSVFPAGDLRKNFSAVNSYPGGTGGATVVIVPTANNASTFSRKYIAAINLSGDSPANIKIIRYADVLLMCAEALNENGKTGTALTYLNMVRERARAIPGATSSATPDITSTDMATVRNAIALERRLELAGESNGRFWDLVRTGKALTTLAPLGMKAHQTIFPVPLTQIQIMNDKTIFAQNPGYN
jgi:tetratricopeptide (TPR) repeat protein